MIGTSGKDRMSSVSSAHNQPVLLGLLTEYQSANSANVPVNWDAATREYENGFSEALDDAVTELAVSVASVGRLISLNRSTVPVSDYERGYADGLSDVEYLVTNGALPGQ
jgi:hypothetical protein